MQKINIKLKNCYGIKELEKEFSFEKSNVNLIYAKNGSMKTSFAKVFKKFQDGKESEICDEIFGEPTEKSIKISNGSSEIDIKKDDIFVIKSFESSYESKSISSLLIDNDLKERLKQVLKLKNNFLKLLIDDSGLKLSSTSGGKVTYILEPQMLSDFGKVNESFLQILEELDTSSVSYDFSGIDYSTIFGATDIINDDIFQNNIAAFLTKSEEIYGNYNFLDQGNFTLAKLKKIEKELNGNKFFSKDNKIKLEGETNLIGENELIELIENVETALQNTDEFKQIEKLLAKPKGIPLKDVIEKNTEIVGELQRANLPMFKKKLWLSYVKANQDKFDELKTGYDLLKTEVDALEIDGTTWNEAIKIFNSRFTLPFKMEIENLTSSIIGENSPQIAFNFCKDGNFDNLSIDNWKKLNRADTDGKDTLSQGERRALYLLNIIFDLEKFKKEFLEDSNKNKLLIIDDIADSFDYKNKYAIIEYIREISNIGNFKMIILSHNFDFYRTLSSRIHMDRVNKFSVNKTISHEIEIEEEEYQGNPFDAWKEVLRAKSRYRKVYTSLDAKKHILALIPFVRNLIEYGRDREVNTFIGIDQDYMFLTNLFHLKDKTKDITFGDLKVVYEEYIKKSDFDGSIDDSDKVFDMIMDISDNHIADNEIKLENKIILAIAIRLEAEKFMKNEINISATVFEWFEGRGNSRARKNGDKTLLLDFINTNGNQTFELFKGYQQIGIEDKIKILDSVNIMTPENIHLNSFMYEPILDMDIIELKKLYSKVAALNLVIT